MVVDDSIVMRTKIEHILQDENYNVVGYAENGRQALTLCRKYQPDIMTLDLVMPDMKGIETIKAVLQEHPNLRILVVSVLADKSMLIHAMSLGAYGFLPKPFTDTAFTTALSELTADLVE